ncbi:Gfo/Idh/MocA family protein [Alteromonas lipotrueae]|uniref:Gfo/Idh/MocA family protein n=1 Tax=Alteromonas lipotrueae TaxID=2803814 RepID=UPI001C45CCF9|nr:Gfo/Idh/MocA family oxidoreductase [Alteromonas lipotrueae]
MLLLFNSPNIDVITVCTPSGFHLEPISAAAKAGKHIICEKPLEVTAERVDEMIAVCAENNVMLAGIFPRRFNASSQLLKKALAQGRFGNNAMADAYIKWWRTQEYYESGA